MSAIKLLAIVLIVAGLLGVGYGKFSYTKETHGARLGPLELSVEERDLLALRGRHGAKEFSGGWLMAPREAPCPSECRPGNGKTPLPG